MHGECQIASSASFSHVLRLFNILFLVAVVTVLLCVFLSRGGGERVVESSQRNLVPLVGGGDADVLGVVAYHGWAAAESLGGAWH